ncbi:hypothetical protein D9615_006297 [Tricholomella constricta]|uniref:Uncharacterized protein n=1 Tax=Tricholomella constricta TaxID=117010 RepID=A0A8H5M3L4_9AGAR|nr:hypothetical protein D9615_006297 [Tricholomella constricta]
MSLHETGKHPLTRQATLHNINRSAALESLPWIPDVLTICFSGRLILYTNKETISTFISYINRHAVLRYALYPSFSGSSFSSPTPAPPKRPAKKVEVLEPRGKFASLI